MQISVRIIIMDYKAEERIEIHPKTTVKELLDQYIRGFSQKIRKAVIGDNGSFSGVILVNNDKVEPEQILKEGDELLILSVLAGG